MRGAGSAWRAISERFIIFFFRPLWDTAPEVQRSWEGSLRTVSPVLQGTRSPVTESARAHSYILSEQVLEQC